LRHGERVPKLKWINQLKIAIIEKNETKIEELMADFPMFSSQEEMEKAAYLMQEAYDLLVSEKEIVAANLLKIKKQKEFLHSTSPSTPIFSQNH